MEKAWFEEWQKPIDVINAVNQIRPDPPNLFFGNQYKWAREAWILGKFSYILGFESCKINKNDPPDGFVRAGILERKIEITECRTPENRTKPENRENEKSYFDKNIIEQYESTFKMIFDETLKNKLSKDYLEKFELLMYVNVYNIFWSQDRISDFIKNLKILDFSKFSRFYFLWDENIFERFDGPD